MLMNLNIVLWAQKIAQQTNKAQKLVIGPGKLDGKKVNWRF